MKKVSKGPAPLGLVNYAKQFPDDSWEKMTGSNTFGGIQAGKDCRSTAANDQGGLCAYCEKSFSLDDSPYIQIEHFHPKRDKSGSINWGLDWDNMLAVCDGGERKTSSDDEDYEHADDRYCDSRKDELMKYYKIPDACEGYIINPIDMPALKNLLLFDKKTGKLKPNEVECEDFEFKVNKYSSTYELVDMTLKILNLNCYKLAKRRLRVFYKIEKEKSQFRNKNAKSGEGYKGLIIKSFSKKWPQHFTVLRCCFGEAAERYLKDNKFNG